MKKRTLMKLCSLTLALLMIASAFVILPTAAASEEEFDVWDGTVDTSWLPTTGIKREFEIDTAEKLAGLAQLVNNKKSAAGAYTGYTFYITKNIDLAYLDWTPIGNETGKAAFGGSLVGKLNGVDGAAVTIKGLSVESETVGAGFIGTHAGGDLANITLDSPVVTSEASNAGIFVGTANNRGRSYTNLTVKNGAIDCYGDAYCGGLIGYCAAAIAFDSCAVQADIVAGPVEPSGGFIGGLTNVETSLTKCFSDVVLHTAGKRGAGFIGLTTSSKLTFTDCQFNGAIDCSGTQGGAFLGRLPAASASASAPNVTFTNCLNTGISVNSYGMPSGYSWIGLVAGDTSATTYINLTFENCYANSVFPYAGRNDYSGSSKPVIINFKANGEQKNNLSLNSGASVLAAYKPAPIKLSTMPAGFSADTWTAEKDKNVVLSIAKDVIRPYSDATDLSWFKLNAAVTSYSLRTTGEVQGLIKLSHLAGIANTYKFAILTNDIDYTRAPDGAFNQSFLEVAKITNNLQTAGGTVDIDVLKLYVQLQKDATLEDESFKIRLVSSIDSMDYFRGGFTLTSAEGSETYKTKYLYTNLNGNRFGDIHDAFCDDSRYYFACVVDGLTQADLDTEYTLQGFYESRNDEGTPSFLYGKTATFTLRELLTKGDTTTPLWNVATNYQIVYPDVQTSSEREVAFDLRELINEASCAGIGIAPMSKASEGKKILVNTTPDSELTFFDFKISEEDGNLVLRGGSKFSLTLAAKELIKQLQTGTELKLDGTYNKTWGFFDWSGRTQIDMDTWKPVWAAYNDYTVLPGNEWLHDFEEKAYALTCPTTEAYRLTSKQHRGDLKNYPDGSLEGIASSIYAGIDCIETDTQMTRDGVMVILHDSTLTRTTNVEEFIGRPGYPMSANINEWTYEQVMDLNMKMKDGTVTEYKMATLYEVLLLIRHRVFIQVDDKGNQMVKNDSKNLYSISQDNNILFQMATDTGSKTSFIYWYGQDSYADLDRWVTMDSNDTEFISFLNKMKRYDAMKDHALREDWWPDGRSGYGSGGLVENKTEWLERRAEGRYMIWTEAPEGLCKFIAENYSPVTPPNV